MKRIFTLIAGLCLFAVGASAQLKWTNVIVNGDMEGEADPEWSSFWCHDYRTPEQVGEVSETSGQVWDDNGQFQGFAEIVEDPANPANHCARVIVRSEAEADADERNNKIVADGALAGWDTQFFIYAKVDEPIPSGKMLRVSFKYKADKEGPSCGTQAHANPGNYNHWAMIGNPSFTTEWKTFEWEGTLSSEQAPADKGFYSIAFNLADYKDGYTAYFDDVKMEVKDQPEPSDFTGWFNFLRKGTLTSDPQQNFTTFTGRDGRTGKDAVARIVNDPIDDQPALNVTTICFDQVGIKTVWEDKVDDDGNPIYKFDDEGNPVWELDDEGNPKVDDEGNMIQAKEQVSHEEEYQYYLDGDGKEVTNIDDWQTQFFVTVPHKFVSGTPYKLVMWARASADCTVDTQAHTMPGSYVHWNFCGSLNLNQDWQCFSFGADDPADENYATIVSEANGCQTIAFNCNKVKDQIIDLYFRFDEFSFNEADVTDADRVLGSGSTMLPLAAGKDSEIKGAIDLAPALETLEAKSWNELEFHVVGEETFSKDVDLSAGVTIDANGWWTEDDEAAVVEFEQDDATTNDNLALNIVNWSGIELGAAQTLDTKFAFQNKDGWRYVYNVSILPEETYTGVEAVETTAAKKSSVVYDLMGRKLANPVRGLYIKDGKKFLVK